MSGSQRSEGGGAVYQEWLDGGCLSKHEPDFNSQSETASKLILGPLCGVPDLKTKRAVFTVIIHLSRGRVGSPLQSLDLRADVDAWDKPGHDGR